MKRAFVFLAVLCLVVIGAGRLEAQQAQGQCLIRLPASGSQVRGQYTVIGTATHPDFAWYQLGYAPDPNPDGKWSFFWSSESAVSDGQLGVWDTTQIGDGTYQLILEVHRKDGNNEHCFVGQLRVNNTAPVATPTFTPAPLPTAADTPTPLPTSEDTPTVVIEQPPTATPRPTPTYSPVDNPTPTPEMTRFRLPIDPATVRNASCRGAQITILMALVVALYFIVRNVVVQGVRKMWKPRDVEGFHSRRPREY